MRQPDREQDRAEDFLRPVFSAPWLPLRGGSREAGGGALRPGLHIKSSAAPLAPSPSELARSAGGRITARSISTVLQPPSPVLRREDPMGGNTRGGSSLAGRRGSWGNHSEGAPCAFSFPDFRCRTKRRLAAGGIPIVGKVRPAGGSPIEGKVPSRRRTEKG